MKHSQEEMETSALVAIIDLFIKTDQELDNTIDNIWAQDNWKLSIYIQLQRGNKKVSKIQDIARIVFDKYWLLQIYCNRRYGIVVAIANTIFSWRRKRWWDSVIYGKIIRTNFSKQYLEGILLLLWLWL